MQKVLLELNDIKKVFNKGSELIKVLDGINLNIHEKQTIGIIGPSGSGKTTVANLLNRFYDVQEGSIKIDGTDIKDMTMNSLRNMLGLVTQDSILFNDTIKNNILIGKDFKIRRNTWKRHCNTTAIFYWLQNSERCANLFRTTNRYGSNENQY